MTHCFDPVALIQLRNYIQKASHRPCVDACFLNLAEWRDSLLLSFQTCLNMSEPELMSDW
jgi:hypothetical protein